MAGRADHSTQRRLPKQQYVAHLDERIGVLSAQIHALNAELAAVVGAFDEAQGWHGWGIRSAAHYLSVRAGWSMSDAQRIARVGARLDEVPTLAEAAGRGEVSLAMVDLAARVSTPANESAVAEVVRLCTPSQAGRVLSKYRELADLPAPGDTAEPPGDSPAEAALRPEHWWRDWVDELGRGRIDAALDASTVELIRQAFAAVAPDETDQPRPGADELAGRLAAAAIDHAESLGRRGPSGERFAVQVTADLATFAAALGLELDSRLPVGLGRQAYLTGPNGRITQLTDAQLEEALCDASVQLLIHADGVPLWLGNEVRHASRHQRRALRHRSSGTCEFPGCSATRHLEPHHVRFHSEGGSTGLDNLVLLCWHHHHELHRLGWEIHEIGHQEFEFRSADGRCFGSNTMHGPPPDLGPDRSPDRSPDRTARASGSSPPIPPRLRLVDPETPRSIGGGEPLTAYGLDVLVASLLLAS